MDDKQWQKKLNKLLKSVQSAKSLLQECEAEYERRFGNNPSNWDDDTWIDVFHLGQANSITVEEVTKSAKFCKRLHPNSSRRDETI